MFQLSVLVGLGEASEVVGDGVPVRAPVSVLFKYVLVEVVAKSVVCMEDVGLAVIGRVVSGPLAGFPLSVTVDVESWLVPVVEAMLS